MRRLVWLMLGILIGVSAMFAAQAMVISMMPPELKYRGVQPAPTEPPRPAINLTPSRPLVFDYQHGWKDGIAFGWAPTPRGYIVPAPQIGPGVTPRHALPDHTVPEPGALALLVGPLAWLIWRNA